MAVVVGDVGSWVFVVVVVAKSSSFQQVLVGEIDPVGRDRLTDTAHLRPVGRPSPSHGDCGVRVWFETGHLTGAAHLRPAGRVSLAHGDRVAKMGIFKW